MRAVPLLALLALAFVPVAAAATVQPGPNDYGPLPTMSGASTASRVEPRFSKAAELVSGGKRVEARCHSTEDWSRLESEWAATPFPIVDVVAYVNHNDRQPWTRVQLSPAICASLVRLTYGRGWRLPARREAIAEAVVTLSHEAQHIRGFADEPVAECFGLQRSRSVARSLGLTRAQANELVALYWKRAYPDNGSEFKSRECRQGGRLDLNLSPSFP